MKVALVYDRVNKFGGAERVLLALHEIWPEAPLYTTVYDPKGASWAKDFDVRPSFMQSIPFAKTHHEIFPWLTPFAFESLKLDEFDVVISVTSAEAKGIITKPKTLHICYCLTPTRYLWSSYHYYIQHPQFKALNPLAKLLTKPILTRLRLWDQIASMRPDYYFAISKNIQKRIEKYYHQPSVLIYPSVDTEKFKIKNLKSKMIVENDKYFLVVSRLVAYKRVDIIIKAFNQLKLPLKIVGDGTERRHLEAIANNNIEFLGQRLTDGELLGYYQNCRALIFAGEEDLGLVSLEAQACGKPVLAYKRGGIKETIIKGKTGELFFPQTQDSLIKKITYLIKRQYNPSDCRKNAMKFDKEIFKEKFKKTVKKIWKNSEKKFSNQQKFCTF